MNKEKTKPHGKPKAKAIQKAKSGSIGESMSKLQKLLKSKPSDFLGKNSEF